jgi:hypothetical protein
MLTRLKTAASFLLLIALSLPLAAQSAAPPQAKPKPAEPDAAGEKSEQKPIPVQQQRALQLLDALFDKAKEVKDEQFKIRAQAQIADALWMHDETRARRYFTDAFQAIDAFKLPADRTRLSDRALEVTRSRLRQEVLALIAPRDMSLAESLLKQIKTSPGEKKPESGLSGAQNEQMEQHLMLAEGIAETNPELAAQIVRNSLQSGFNPRVIRILIGIRRKNPALANQVFAESLMATRHHPASLISDLSALAAYANPDAEENLPGDNLASETVRLAVMEQFLNFAYGALLAQVNAESPSVAVAAQRPGLEIWALQDLLSLFNRFMPDKAEAIRVRFNQALALLPEKQRELFDRVEEEDSEALESLLKRAESASNFAEKDDLYAQAAQQTFWQGDLDEAIFIAQKISDWERRFASISRIYYQAGMKAMSRKDWEEARRYAKEVTSLPERVELYKQIAQMWLDKKDHSSAHDVLNEIEQWVAKADSGGQKAQALLSIAELISRYDALRSFEVMQTAVKAVNAVDFNPPMPGQTVKLKVPPVPLEMLDFKTGFSRLARSDFDRALGLAQLLEKKEAAVIAQLAICYGALNNPAAAEEKDKKAAEEETSGKKSPDKKEEKREEKKPPIK